MTGPLRGWREERQSAWLYRIIAEVEAGRSWQSLFEQLADEADQQARIWAEQALAKGTALPEFRPSARARLVAALVRRLGARRMRPVLSAMKVRGMSVFTAGGAHHPMPETVDQVGQRHHGQAGNLRAAVFGVNDGLVSNASLILGVAGASGDPQIVLVSGTAGLLAGAFSMAAGEYVSVRSQREMLEYQLELEREELARYPGEEAQELALIYQARGIPIAEAQRMADRIIADPETALQTLAREELGLDPDELGAPWGAAISSFGSFAVGAALPLLPWAFGAAGSALPLTIGLTAIALFGVGAAISLFTGRQALWGGLRMLLIGGGAGAITWAIGALLGVGLG